MKIHKPGMYGLTTQGMSVRVTVVIGVSGCATNLRNMVSGAQRSAHSFGSTFDGNAGSCGATEASTPCNGQRLCSQPALRKAEQLSGFLVPTKSAAFKLGVTGSYGSEV